MDIGEVRLKLLVPDVVAEKKFWVDRLGFAIIKTFPGGMMIDLGGTRLEVFLDTNAAPSGMGISIEVTDLDDVWEQWADSPDVVHPLRASRWGDRSFALRGPNGIEVVLFQPI